MCNIKGGSHTRLQSKQLKSLELQNISNLTTKKLKNS